MPNKNELVGVGSFVYLCEQKIILYIEEATREKDGIFAKCLSLDNFERHELSFSFPKGERCKSGTVLVCHFEGVKMALDWEIKKIRRGRLGQVAEKNLPKYVARLNEFFINKNLAKKNLFSLEILKKDLYQPVW